IVFIVCFSIVFVCWIFNMYGRLTRNRVLKLPEIIKENVVSNSEKIEKQTLSVVKERGYSGEIELAVKTDSEGNILSVDVLKHSETSIYVNAYNLSKFLKSLAGKNVNEKLQPGKNVDAISGATLTTEAILTAIMKVSTISPVAKLSITPIVFIKNVFLKRQTQSFLAFILLSFFCFFHNGVHTTDLRTVSLFICIAYIGIYADLTFSVVNILNLMTMRFPALQGGEIFYLYFAIIFISVFLFGRYYCGWLCPYGALHEFLGKWTSAIYPQARDKKIEASLYLKYVLLSAAISLALLKDKPVIANYEPFTTTFNLLKFRVSSIFPGGIITITALLFLVYSLIAMFAAFVTNRFFCKYICPVGATLGACSHLTLWKLKIGRNCNLCGKCIEVCPVGAIESGPQLKINISECIQCNVCIRECPESAIYR
ncbi:MAG: 4Fe-4S binding protein, partial [Elusimicrobiota bacterium]